MIRPLVMEYPKDPIAKTQNLSYMLGDALLISPGFDRDEYELYLPEGRWQDIESKEVYEGMTFVHIETKLLLMVVHLFGFSRKKEQVYHCLLKRSNCMCLHNYGNRKILNL